MSENVVGVYDKVVVSISILAAIVALFKAGFIAAVGNFLFFIIFLKVAQALWCWIFSDG
jgi:hypothetical protein